MPQGELTGVPLVAECALPVHPTAPPFIGVNPAAHGVVLSEAIEERSRTRSSPPLRADLLPEIVPSQDPFREGAVFTQGRRGGHGPDSSKLRTVHHPVIRIGPACHPAAVPLPAAEGTSRSQITQHDRALGLPERCPHAGRNGNLGTTSQHGKNHGIWLTRLHKNYTKAETAGIAP